MLQTILNSRMRTPDGTILESKHRHDYVTHLDANGKEYFLDGGLDYVRSSANGDEYLLTIYPDYPHELIRLHAKWGTYGKNGDETLVHVAIADLSSSHLRAIIDTQQKTMRPEMYKVIQDEVDYRNAPPEMDDREVVIDVDQANKQSYIEAKASRFKAWITEPVVVYKIHLIATTLLLATFIGYELMIYPLS